MFIKLISLCKIVFGLKNCFDFVKFISLGKINQSRNGLVYIDLILTRGFGLMEDIVTNLIKFQKERDWKKFHTPENLAKSISIESAELLEHFQWQKEYDEEEVAEELADVLIYCFYMAIAMDLDVKEIILNKMEKNAIKYPVDKSRGNAKKYTEF